MLWSSEKLESDPDGMVLKLHSPDWGLNPLSWDWMHLVLVNKVQVLTSCPRKNSGRDKLRGNKWI